ncbi:hypothetical protein [Mangrovimonas sp. DI 80]|uniref:hypothetical protein n=1 Tax=Mangrovimonas sp. DI 80 TaxID=1779330 RepID=UPI0009787015|nr:hypothetical protein [Mangrovimonas sp. DI 80]OMP29793.1 hypothetical protein BKM32_15990 [Mangrovimonas sp. DI 80]
MVFSLGFIGLQLLQYEYCAMGVRALMLILLSFLYVVRVKNKRNFFFLFLLAYTLSDVINFITWEYSTEDGGFDYYYLGNGLYILSYLFLVAKLLQSIKIREVAVKLPFHVLILFILDCFCVVIVTNTTKSELGVYPYVLEFIYNAVIMLLLTLALLNYIHKDDKKSMNFLIGSICIVFYEVIQLAYFYISETNILNVISSVFLVLAFVFLYLQSRLVYSERMQIANS